MRVFINAILAHMFLNIYVFLWGWKAIPPKLAYRIPFVAVFLVELTVYLTGFTYVEEITIETLYPIMILGTSWLVFLIYMTMFLFAYDVLRYAQKLIKPLSLKVKFNFKKNRVKYYLISVVLVGIIMTYGTHRFWNPVVTELNIKVEKESPVKNLKIAMVSDIHVGYMINREVLKMYIDRIMEQKPDMILLVGDIIDYDMKPLEEEKMEEEFKRLKAPYGVYATTGNHEYRLNAEEKIKWLSEKAGLTVLRDSAVCVNNAFWIVGREDDHQPKRKELSQIMQNVDKKLPVIVMNHEPHRLYEESDAGADLAVYGHTHNGQLFPYNIVINLIYEVGYGYKKKDNTHIYVTSGLGLSGPQYRIGTLSEIVIINMETKK